MVRSATVLQNHGFKSVFSTEEETQAQRRGGYHPKLQGTLHFTASGDPESCEKQAGRSQYPQTQTYTQSHTQRYMAHRYDACIDTQHTVIHILKKWTQLVKLLLISSQLFY